MKLRWVKRPSDTSRVHLSSCDSFNRTFEEKCSRKTMEDSPLQQVKKEWRHPSVSAEAFLKSLETFLQLLVTAKSAVVAQWDVERCTKALAWAKYFEEVGSVTP